MKNYLIITVGTRDVQLRRNLIEQSDKWSVQEIKDVKSGREQTFIERDGQRIAVNTAKDFPDYYTISPRKAGEQLAEPDAFSLVVDVLDLPLITPIVDQLAREQKVVDVVLLIYTNQENEYAEGTVKEFHYQNDTLYFSSIIEQTLRLHPSLKDADFDQYEVFERVADIDYQYEQFAAKNHSLFDEIESVKSIFLVPQGGIDQINQAVTLQLIQAFKHKVKLYQKPDGAEPIVLKFTDKFLDDLNKQKIRKHLEDYDFGAIDKGITSNKLIYNLAQYAYKRLNLQYDILKVNQDFLTSGQLNIVSDPNFLLLDNSVSRLRDLYISAKIQYHQRKYADMLWRIFTVGENLFKTQIETITGPVDKYWLNSNSLKNAGGINLKWENHLNSIDNSVLKSLKNAKNSKGYPVGIDNPNRWSFQALYKIFAETGLIDHSHSLTESYLAVGNSIEELASSRNRIAHKLKSVSLDEINEVLRNSKKEYTVVPLFNDLDQIFDVTGFGLYDAIANEIDNLL